MTFKLLLAVDHCPSDYSLFALRKLHLEVICRLLKVIKRLSDLVLQAKLPRIGKRLLDIVL